VINKKPDSRFTFPDSVVVFSGIIQKLFISPLSSYKINKNRYKSYFRIIYLSRILK